jgi:hypothetical protein
VITQPVFIANGDHDLMVASSNSVDMANRIPNARLTIYPNSGHGGVFQHHRQFISEVVGRYVRRRSKLLLTCADCSMNRVAQVAGARCVPAGQG